MEPSYGTFDSIPSKLLKMIMHIFPAFLFPVFSAIAITGTFPHLWKTAITIVIVQSGSRCSKDSYQPRSLLPKRSLIFECFLFTLLHDSLENKLIPKQIGLQSDKKQRSIHWTFFNNYFIIYATSFAIKSTWATQSSWQGAFKIPLCKLAKFGVDNGISGFFESCFRNRMKIVFVNGLSSDAADVFSGVLQCFELTKFIHWMPFVTVSWRPWTAIKFC